MDARLIRCVMLVALWGLPCIAGLPRAAAATFTTPVLLNTDNPSSLTEHFAPVIATDGDGIWVAVWYAGQNPFASNLYFSRSTNNGKSWSSSALVGNYSGNDAEPSIATDRRGNWVISFRSTDTFGGTIQPGTNVLAVHSSDNGQTWSLPSLVNPNAATKLSGEWDGSAKLATDGAGNWVILWSYFDFNNDTGSAIYTALSTDNGLTWGGRHAIDSTGLIRDFHPALTNDRHGHWFAGWQDVNNNLRIASSTNLGVSWSNYHTITGPGVTQGVDCDIAANETGGAVVVFESNSHIERSYSTDSGVTWSPATPIDTTVDSLGGKTFPFVSTDNNVWVANWIEYPQSGGFGVSPRRFNYAVSRDSGATWGPTQSVFDSAYDYLETAFNFQSAYRGMASDLMGHWIIVWSTNTPSITQNGKLNIQYASSDTIDRPLKVLAPDGGETLFADSLTSISWESDVPMVGTDVEFTLLKGGEEVADLGSGSSSSGLGTSIVYLPLVPSGSDYRVRITSSINPGLTADSDSTFTIIGNTIKVRSPNGSEHWNSGDKQTIIWAADSFFTGEFVDLQLWDGATQTADLGFVLAFSGDIGTRITVPLVPSGSNYRVRIRSVSDPRQSDDSDGPFTILGASQPSAVRSGEWVNYN